MSFTDSDLIDDVAHMIQNYVLVVSSSSSGDIAKAIIAKVRAHDAHGSDRVQELENSAWEDAHNAALNEIAALKGTEADFDAAIQTLDRLGECHSDWSTDHAENMRRIEGGE
jgi:hypothetical protein